MPLTEGNKKIGSVMVVGAGVAGLQASLDLATSGFKVYLVERAPSIGGLMAQLDKTFPTNDCDMCYLAPTREAGTGCVRFGLVVGRHPHIEVLVDTEVESLSGEAGNFHAVLKSRPRGIDQDKCTACGECTRVCPVRAVNEFNAGLEQRPAAYLSFPMAVPRVFSIDLEACNNCGLCVEACPSQAVNYADQPRHRQIDIGAVVLAIGNATFNPSRLLPYHYGSHPNVITSLEFERLFSGTGPTQGRLLRPSDQKEPAKIAWLQCIGSRDLHTHSYCSDVCCMYAIKEAVLAQDRVQQDLDTAIFFMDMRTCGKEYEQYYQRAKQKNGVRFIRYRVPEIMPAGDDLRISYTSATGEKQSEVFNLVVLSVGFEVSPEARDLAANLGIELDRHNFARTAPGHPVASSRPGIYVCGTLPAPKDIPRSITEASAAAASCSALLQEARWTQTPAIEVSTPNPELRGGELRLGVFVCSCGDQLAEGVDLGAVRAYAATLPGVVYVENNPFACFPEALERITQVIKDNKLNRVVVAACSPLTHGHLFRKALENAGLNPYFVEMANIREQVAWVHRQEQDQSRQKAQDLVRQAVARVSVAKPLKGKPLPVEQQALVVGGGVAGMTAALNLAGQGVGVYLVEKKKYLGGLAPKLHRTIDGLDVDAYLSDLINRVECSANLEIILEAEIVRHQGFKGNFTTTVVQAGQDARQLNHGVVVIATGAREYTPQEFLYGQDKRVLSQLELGELIHTQPEAVTRMQRLVMIQCIGSRNDDNPNCSRICCQSAVKQALRLKEISPELDIIILYRDLRLYGLLEDYYITARDRGVLFVRFDPEQPPQLSETGGVLKIGFWDNVLQRQIQVTADAVILSSATLPSPQDNLADLLKVERSDTGFFTESHPKLRPVDSLTEGIYFCGLAHSPQLLSESIAQALAAAGRAGAFLADRSLSCNPVVSQVDPNDCVACLACVRTCPYGVPSINQEHKSEINPALCQGCGVCAAVCPAQAIQLAGFEDAQVMAEIRAL